MFITPVMWSGSWYSGDIVVPNSSNHDLFFYRTTIGVGILIKYGNSIRGFGFTHLADGGNLQSFLIAYNGDTWTLMDAYQITHDFTGGSLVHSVVNPYITFIHGIR